MIDVDDIDPAFGHWLAGFVDGEGSFNIGHPRKQYICLFKLGLRRDDLPILIECQEQTGLGRITHRIVRSPRSDKECPQSQWEIGGKLPCAGLVKVFDRFPLRAKKARDFVIWREAVAEWNRIGPGQGRYGTDWTRMGELKHALMDGRRYRDPDDELPVGVAPPAFRQLHLAA